MDNPRAEKVAVVKEVRNRFDESDAAILTEYRGLKVKELAELRRSLRANGGDYKVYKNTLVRLATREVGIDGLDGLLTGPTGVAFVHGDAAAVAKSLRDFARTNANLVVKGGVLGDKILTPADTTALAELPSRDVLLAQFAGALAAPLQQLAGLLEALPRNLAYGLAALRDQRADGAAADQPAESAPAEAVPADAVPADVASTETTPAEAAADEAAPAEPAPAEATAADDAPTGAPAEDPTAEGAG